MGVGFAVGAGFSQSGSGRAAGLAAAAVLVPVGSVVVGYFLGKNLDKRELTVVIIR